MRSSVLKRAVAALTAFAMAFSPIAAVPAAAQRTQVGNAATVVGTVTMLANGGGKSLKVQRKQRFAWGDVVSTAKKSQLQILLLDRSSYGLGANTKVRIDRFVYNPGSESSSVATMITGGLRYLSGRKGTKKSGEIKTPAGRIGIRGTAVDILVGSNAAKIAGKEKAAGKVKSKADEATLVVLRGPGAQTLGDLTPGIVDVEGGGVTVTLDEPGLAVFIPRAGAAPIGPFRISDSGLERVQKELAPEVARANSGSLLDTLIPAALGAIALGVLISELDGKGDTPAQPGTADNPNRPGTANDPRQPGTSNIPIPNRPPTTSDSPTNQSIPGTPTSPNNQNQPSTPTTSSSPKPPG